MVFAETGIHAEQIALPVVLLLEIFRRLNAGHPAEIVLADDPHAEIVRFALLLTFLRVRAPFRAHHDERRLCRHLVGGGAAETDHERLCFLAPQRRKFAGEDDDLIGKRGFGAVPWISPPRAGMAALRRAAVARHVRTRAEAAKMQ